MINKLVMATEFFLVVTRMLYTSLDAV